MKVVSEKFILAGLNNDVKSSGSLSSVSEEVCWTWPLAWVEPANSSVSIPLKKKQPLDLC